MTNGQFDRELEERLCRYAAIDTTSAEASPSIPSTERQWDLLNLLVDELKEIGASDIRTTEYAVVLATLPATIDTPAPVIGFLAHVDTTEAFPGADVKPVVHRNYDGRDITFADNADLLLSPVDSAYLGTKLGDDIITASGATLLGADDKAGCAIIMTMARYLLAHPEVPRGELRLCFTVDEEIGRGVHEKLPADLKVDFAYTLDGAEAGEIVYETFSADKAVVHIEGVSIHPAVAKGKLVNALTLGAKILNTLPSQTRVPEMTDDRDGFLMAYQTHGNTAALDIEFILRDFERDGLQSHGDLLRQVCDAVAATEPRAHITCTITPQYRNMRYWLENDMRPVELALEATRQSGLEPFSPPTRGGTDGSRLTEKGVPTPNLFTGMQNYHGPLEWVSVQDMARATEMCIKLAELAARGASTG